VGAGKNTSTVALRVVEGDEKEIRRLGFNWATLSLGDINTETWSSRCNVAKFSTEGYGSKRAVLPYMIMMTMML
jgi:hypothetical protein